jgi:hypothetical protein
MVQQRCSEVLDQKKLAKLQWLQDPNKINVDNVNSDNVRPADISGVKRGNI